MPDTLRIEIDQRGIAVLTLARPEKRNALNARMVTELTQAAADLGADRAVRVVVLTGEGAGFCAGGDLDDMQRQIRGDRAGRMAEALRMARMLDALNRLPKPLIGRINGAALGGGVGLVAVCDAAVAVRDARFALSEVRLGLIPATISPYVLGRLGEARGRQVFFSGRAFDAAEAAALGLIARAVTAADLDAAVAAETAPYLLAAPEAVAAAKRLARDLGPRIDAAVMEDTARRLADTWETASAAEGVAAFLEKRAPVWPGPPRSVSPGSGSGAGPRRT